MPARDADSPGDLLPGARFQLPGDGLRDALDARQTLADGG